MQSRHALRVHALKPHDPVGCFGSGTSAPGGSLMLTPPNLKGRRIRRKKKNLRGDSSDGTKASDFLSICLPTSLSTTHREAIIVLPCRDGEEEEGEDEGKGTGKRWKHRPWRRFSGGNRCWAPGAWQTLRARDC